MSDAKEGFSMITKIAAALAVLSAAGATVGYNFPQIATKDQVVEVAGAAQTNANEIILLKLRIAKRDLTENLILQEQMKAKGEAVPSWLLRDQAKTEDEIENLKRQLK